MTSLRRRMLEDMRLRNLSPQTQLTYIQQVARFARHFRQSPADLGPEAIRAYQLYLTTERGLAVESVMVAVAALRFLYTVTLKQAWRLDEVLPVPRRPQRLPVVLSPEEVLQFLDAVGRANGRGADRGSPNPSARTRCATPSRSICSNRVPMCARFNCSSATGVSPPRCAICA